LPHLGISGRHLPLKIAAPIKQGYPHIGKLPRSTPVSDLHMTFNLLYVYDYITDYAGNKQKSYKVKRTYTFTGVGQGEARHRKYKRLELGGGQAYDHSSD
jgi:hypothetical protein